MESNSETAIWSGWKFTVIGNTFIPLTSSLAVPEISCRAADLIAGPLILVDLCAGSGALGIATYLKKKTKFQKLVSLDSMHEAITSIRTNLGGHDIPGEARLWHAGEPISFNQPSLIICNPPFLPVKSPRNRTDKSIYCANNGIEVALRCFESAAGNRGIFVLKCLSRQLPTLQRHVGSRFSFLYSCEGEEDERYGRQIVSVWKIKDI